MAAHPTPTPLQSLLACTGEGGLEHLKTVLEPLRGNDAPYDVAAKWPNFLQAMEIATDDIGGEARAAFHEILCAPLQTENSDVAKRTQFTQFRIRLLGLTLAESKPAPDVPSNLPAFPPHLEQYLPSGFPQGSEAAFRMLLLDPFYTDTYLVFADFLQDRGDPRVESLRAFVDLTLPSLRDQYASAMANLHTLQNAEGEPLLTNHDGRLSFVGENRERYFVPTLDDIARGLVSNLGNVLRSNAECLRTFSITPLLPLDALGGDVRRRLEGLRDRPHPELGANYTSLCATDIQGNPHPLRRDQVSDDDPLYFYGGWRGDSVRFEPTLTREGALTGGQTLREYQAAHNGFLISFEEGLPFLPHQDDDPLAPDAIFREHKNLIPGGLSGQECLKLFAGGAPVTHPKTKQIYRSEDCAGLSPCGLHQYLCAIRTSLAVDGRLLDCRFDAKAQTLQWAGRWLLDTYDTSSGLAGFAYWGRHDGQARVVRNHPDYRYGDTACPRSLRVEPLGLGI